MQACWFKNKQIIDGTHYSLLEIKENGKVQRIAVDKNILLGKGGYAKVYQGYYLLETGKRDIPQPLAVRVEDLSRAKNVGKMFKEREQEATEQRKMIPTDIYLIGNDAVSVMPDLGKPILVLREELKRLTLSQKFELAALVIQACAEFHARRYHWVNGQRVLRDGLSHTDLKPGNFLIKIEYDKKDKERKHPKFTCTLIDFTTPGIRTPAVTAPECIHGEKIREPVAHALEMETYAEVSLIAPILGEDILYVNKENTWEEGSQFTLKRMNKKLRAQGKLLGLTNEMEQVIDTVESMRDSNPAKRPSDLAIIKVLNRARISCIRTELRKELSKKEWTELELDEANVDEKHTKKVNEIFCAIRLGKLDTVAAEIVADPTLLAQVDLDGLTPLGVAVKHGQYAIVEYLLLQYDDKARQIAEVTKQTDWNGRPLLHLAVLGNHAELVLLLLKNGNDANQKDADGRTPLHCALAMRCDSALVKILLDNGADITQKNVHGRTPLQAAIANACSVDVVNILIEEENKSKPAAEKEDDFYHTILPLAAVSGSVELVERFIKNNNLHLADKNKGRSLLHVATIYNHISLVSFLIEQGLDKNAKDSNGNTPLHYAARGGMVEVASILLANNKKSISTDKGGKAFHQIVDRSGKTLLNLAVIKGNVKLAQSLIAKGADVNANDDNGTALLHLAILKDNYEMVQLFLEKGANIEAKGKNGCTALHFAVDKGNAKMVQLLLQKGVHIAATDEYGDTPLHYAANKGHVSLVKILAETWARRGGNVNRRNVDGKTPLDIAKEDKRFEIKVIFTTLPKTSFFKNLSSFFGCASATEKIPDVVYRPLKFGAKA